VDSNGDVVQNSETGETSKEWSTFDRVAAAVEPLSGKEFIAAQANQSKVSTRITIRYLAGVNAGMRIVEDGKIYNIEAVLPDKNSGIRYLTLLVSDGVNDNGQ
jgi:SPP1 family predicted phage head-tail adaptor